MTTQAQSELLDHLRNRIRSVETAGRVADGTRVSSGCAAIDRLLPENGYQRGTLVQWLSGGGQSADYLSLLVAREACTDGGALVVFDPWHQFYPPAAAAIGINLDNLIMLRNREPAVRGSAAKRQELSNDLLWSIDQSLRCPAVAAVWGPLDQIHERWFRRFQLSAESSGCLGLFVQPLRAARDPSWAEVQWLVSGVRDRGKFTGGSASNEHLPTAGQQQLVRLQLTRCRGTQTGKTVQLSINTITGNVQLARRDHEQHLRSRFGQTKTNPVGKANGARKGFGQSGTYGPTGSYDQPGLHDPPELHDPPGLHDPPESNCPPGAHDSRSGSPTGPLPVASQLAHPAAGRQRA